MPRRSYSKQTIAKNTPVCTIKTLLSIDFIAPRACKEARIAGAFGLVFDVVDQGASGSAYLVHHEGATTPAIYSINELEMTSAYWRLTYTLEGGVYFKEFDIHHEIKEFIQDNGVDSPTVEGPFFSDKELEEGEHKRKSLFDHLVDEDA